MAGYYDKDKAPNEGTTTVTVGGNMGWPRPHLNHVPEYQASGFPFLLSLEGPWTTGQVVNVKFPFITRWIKIAAHYNNSKAVPDVVTYAFSQDGLSNAFADVSYASEARLELKCSGLFFEIIDSSRVDHIEIIAGLTNISADTMRHLENLSSGTTSIPGFNSTASYTIT